MDTKYFFTIDRVPTYKDETFTNLQQLYEFELSSITEEFLDLQGRYDQEKIKQHWSKDGYDIFLFREVVGSKLIGFAVINHSSMVNGAKNTRDVAEFFILPHYRRQHMGMKIAHAIFDMYPPRTHWEVRQLKKLGYATDFWKKVIQRYTKNNYIETAYYDKSWGAQMEMQSFLNYR